MSSNKNVINHGNRELDQEEQQPTTSQAALAKAIINSANNTAKKKKSAKKKAKRRTRERRLSAASHQEMLRKVRERYGSSNRNNKEELKEPLWDKSSAKALHPASYERMMARARDAHLNRMLQPEPPDDLLPSNWVCALCFRPAGTDEQLGELFGPYFIHLSANCQPPDVLVPREMLSPGKKQPKEDPMDEFDQPSTSSAVTASSRTIKRRLTSSGSSANSPLSGKRQASSSSLLRGSIDIWLHGECALWAPELILVGGRLPTLQLHIQRYWKQVCAYCSGIGATIPITMGRFSDTTTVTTQSTPSPLSKNRKRKASASVSISSSSRTVNNDENESHFVHYPCASISGCKLDEFNFRCFPPPSE